MELTLNVTDDKFKEIINKQLEAFSEEELKDICRQGILKLLSDPDTFKWLFVDKKSSYGYVDSFEASEVLKTAAKTINFDETFKEIQEDIIDYIKTNYKDLLYNLAIEAFINGFNRNFFYNNDTFLSELKTRLSQH